MTDYGREHTCPDEPFTRERFEDIEAARAFLESETPDGK
jgi:hypothetical protein